MRTERLGAAAFLLLVPVLAGLAAACAGTSIATVPFSSAGVHDHQIPHDCPADHWWPPYGCLNVAQTMAGCSWVHSNREEVTRDEIRLTVASGRMLTVDETEMNEMAGLRAVAALRVVEFLVGTSVYREVLGSAVSGGFSDTGHGKYSEMGAVQRSFTSGTARFFTIPDVCNFTVHGPQINGVRLYQAYGRVVIRKDDLAGLVEAVTEDLDKLAFKAREPELRARAGGISEAIRGATFDEIDGQGRQVDSRRR